MEARDRDNAADLAATLIHEDAHSFLYFDDDEGDVRAKREVEAEAVAYIVGRYFALDMFNAAFYIAAWQDDTANVLSERIDRISTTSNTLIASIDSQIKPVASP